MEEELNYLSETIKNADLEIIRLKQNKACLESKIAKDHYAEQINKKAKEKQLLENILNSLTINELKQ